MASQKHSQARRPTEDAQSLSKNKFQREQNNVEEEMTNTTWESLKETGETMHVSK